MYEAILFDLDGTLLPMEMKEFIEGYFGILAQQAESRGYAGGKLFETMERGMEVMIQNDGTQTNEARFWALFQSVYGDAVLADKPFFDEFYRGGFDAARRFTQPNPLAREAVLRARERAGRVILATNPVFPEVAVRARLRWIDLSPEDFDLVTTYENSCRCKPTQEYYRAILSQFGLDPTRCLMVGNDIREDILPTASLGLSTFLVTDCVIRRGLTHDGAEGGFADLLDYLKNT